MYRNWCCNTTLQVWAPPLVFRDASRNESGPARATPARYAWVVKRPLFLPASIASVTLAALAALAPPAFARPSALPTLPGADSPSSGAPATTIVISDPPSADGSPSPVGSPGPPAPPASPQQLYERVRRSIVALERNGVPLAIGTILDGDGRILTSLSGLGGAESADVRYADGTTVRAGVGNADKVADLALLVPSTTRWTEGLAASEADPVGASLRAILPSRGAARLGPAEAGVKGRVEAHSRDGAPLAPMLDVSLKGPIVAGAPLLDEAGSVVGVLVHACRGPAASRADAAASGSWVAWAGGQDATPKPAPAACTPVVVGAPVSAIRSFLMKAMSAPAPAPWLGIRGEKSDQGAVHGVRVVAVAPSSPAQQAGLKPETDVIVAADGHPIDTPENLGSAIAKHAPGDTVKLLVFGDQSFREVVVALRAAP
jgi:S1-C subfamily serine protease